MSFNASQRSNAVGFTQIEVGLSASVQVPQAARENSRTVKLLSGTTCMLVTGESNIHSDGYPLSTSSAVLIDGPASFWLAAAGATAVVAVAISKSDSGV